jgi:lipoprotein-releasing system ATP-binding protein
LVLKGVDLTIRQGEIVSIVGPSGSGKSTLLHILGTLDHPTKGIVTINDQKVNFLNDKQVAAFRNRHIGFVFQFHHLLPEFTAVENVCIPGWMAGKKKKDVEERAVHLLETLGLGSRVENKPSALSGGEQQRVAVARALINNPDIIFADEPTGNLDSANARELHQLFFDLRKQFNQTFLIVTHNEELAQMSDRILHMKDGKIV